MTYNRRHASQLEILEVIHFAGFFLLFGIFGIGILSTSLAAGTAPSLDIVMHFPCKVMHIVTVGTGKKTLQNQILCRVEGRLT
jgi:hypothetical protein